MAVRVVLQRVSEAEVTVGDETVGRIGRGLVLLAAVGRGDTADTATRLAERCARLRVFPGEGGHFEDSVEDVGGEVLAVSQFTLYGDCRKGRRPSLSQAAAPEEAEPIFDGFVETLRGRGLRVETGRFGALMRVRLVNDGPVTFQIEL